MSSRSSTARDVRTVAVIADRSASTWELAVRRVLVPLVVALVAAVAVVPADAQGSGPSARDPEPRPNAVVAAGEVRISATVDGGEVRVVVDGREHGALGPEGVVVDVPAGGHLVELVAGGAPVRSWRFHAAGLQATSAGQDHIAVGLAASQAADGADPRPVLLANLDQPALSVSLGPLAVATGAVTLPTGPDRVGEAVLEHTAEIAGPGGDVLVLGGLDAVSADVVGQLEARGLTVRRVGSGTPAQVAAAAAAHRPAQDVYRRHGGPLTRPVLVAAAQPLSAAVQAAAVAARYGASLVVAEADGLDPAAAEVIGSRRAVWLDASLSDAAAEAARSAADEDAEVTERPSDPAPAKHVWVADVSADPGTALLAARAGGTGAAVLVDPARGAGWVAVNQPAGATTVGPVQPATVAAWSVDGPSAPTVQARLEGTQLQMAVDRQVDDADVYVTAGGREWPGRTSVEGQQVTWTPGPRPQLGDDVEAAMPTDVPVEVTAVVAAGGHLRHVHLAQQVTVQPLASTSPEGFLVAGGSSAVVGTGPLRTFTIEIEPSTGLDLQAVASEAEEILLDPTHGWAARGQRSMQRVADPAAADIRVVVATPGTVDRFCGRVGLDTGGRLSCWDGRRAMLNLTRWNTGVSPFHTDLEVYRRYLVSHEVGHGLGYGHVGCPGSGALAPVMMQQSKGLGGCRPNGWPYP